MPIGRGLVPSATLVGAIGFYFLGLDRAPAAQVTLVTDVWPLMFVAASEVLTLGRGRGVVLAGCAVASAGSAVLVTGGHAYAVPLVAAGALVVLGGAAVLAGLLLAARRTARA